MKICKIISGGQTGVDRAALDAAMANNIPYGGWCPKGRKAEDGIIADKYLLKETVTDNYSERTKLNIRDSDGTLVLVYKIPVDVNDGTILTINYAQEEKKPLLIIALDNPELVSNIQHWIDKNNLQILNIAGPRESQCAGIYSISFKVLHQFLFMVTQETKQATNSIT